MVKKTKNIRQRLSTSDDVKLDEVPISGQQAGTCPVPMITCCKKGTPITEENGVKMFCSSKDCTILNILHKECFEELECGLIKMLQNKGSARRWTEDQRMSNLWTKKGMNILARFLRCKCSKGILDKREDFRMPDKPIIVDVFPKTEHNHTIKKKRELPTLNTSTKPPGLLKSGLLAKKLGKFNPHFMETHSDDEEDSIPKFHTSDNMSPRAKLKSSPAKEDTKLNYATKVKPEPTKPVPPSTEWPALDGTSDKTASLNVILPKPKKTFSEVTQQFKPKVVKKPVEVNVYKVLSRKDIEVRRLPGFRKPAEPSESEHSVSSRAENKENMTTTYAESECSAFDKMSVVSDQDTKGKSQSEFYQTGPIPGLARDLISASPDPSRFTPSVLSQSSRLPASPSYSDVSYTTFESDENKAPADSISDALKSISIRSVLTQGFLDMNKINFGPIYRSNETFIQSLLEDTDEFFHPQTFVDDKKVKSSIWPAHLRSM
ncbi:unnamed protein product [Bursaphelenchus okinawaensis]|uniref:Headcase N-terminal domain-containing protein n=1 Tax=Bursaphelenchus okinawaensis TaxID=465554 RepID=A0A811L623_9BILA|nr:unnamed protein product [Bursaphelenchus okinawaensis]CAG9118592.1 unnamed protein product [Bursaphelenchus okinawaensis]